MIEQVVAWIVAMLALVKIVREDVPASLSEWCMALIAAAQLGVAYGFAVWFVRLLIAAGWDIAGPVLFVTAAVFYVWIGALYAAHEARIGGVRGLLYGLVMFCCWPVVVVVAARALSDND